MATSSFFEHIVIDSDEKAIALIEAYEDQVPIERIDIHAILKRGEESIKQYFSDQKDL